MFLLLCCVCNLVSYCKLFIYLLILIYRTDRQCLMHPGHQPKIQSYIYRMIFDIKSQSRVELIIAYSLDLNRGRVLLSIKSLGKSFQSWIVLGKSYIYDRIYEKGSSTHIQFYKRGGP